MFELSFLNPDFFSLGAAMAALIATYGGHRAAILLGSAFVCRRYEQC